MKCNVGKNDKVFRLIISLILIVASLQYGVWWLLIIAVILIITVLTGKCLPYTWFGINTNK